MFSSPSLWDGLLDLEGRLVLLISGDGAVTRFLPPVFSLLDGERGVVGLLHVVPPLLVPLLSDTLPGGGGLDLAVRSPVPGGMKLEGCGGGGCCSTTSPSSSDRKPSAVDGVECLDADGRATLSAPLIRLSFIFQMSTRLIMSEMVSQSSHSIDSSLSVATWRTTSMASIADRYFADEFFLHALAGS